MTTDKPDARERLASEPTMRTPDTTEKRVGWAELFFDLVFVFAITQVSMLLHAEHSWAGIGRALVVFVPIYWAWAGTAVHANTRDVNNPIDRLGIFALGLCGLFMALAAPAAYTDRGVLFGAGYLALRIILAALIWRGHRMVLGPFLIQVFLTGPLLLVGGFLPDPVRLGVWALVALVDLSTPALTRSALTRVAYAPAHLPERFGLFLIIALGETIVAIGGAAAATARLDAAVLVGVGIAFALTGALWWLYFGGTASSIPTALASARVQTDFVRQVLSYAHLALIAAIIATASGIAGVLTHPTQLLDHTLAGLLFGGCALYLAALNYTLRRSSFTHLAGAAISVALLPATSHIPALAALAALAAALVMLNIVDHRRHSRAGRVTPDSDGDHDACDAGLTGDRNDATRQVKRG